MTGEEISGLADKVAEKLGVASEYVVEAFQSLAAEYQAANLAVAMLCGGILVIVFLLGISLRAGGRYMANRKSKPEESEDWLIGTFLASWIATVITAIICFAAGGHYLYHAMMPHVSLLARLGLLQ